MPRGSPEHKALQAALAQFDDNQSAMARAINEWLEGQGREERVRQSNISWWLHHSHQVSPHLAQAVAAVSGVPVEQLLPQVYTAG